MLRRGLLVVPSPLAAAAAAAASTSAVVFSNPAVLAASRVMTTAATSSNASTTNASAATASPSSSAALVPAAAAALTKTAAVSAAVVVAPRSATTFVFNPFSGRLTARSAPVFAQLRAIGIAAPDDAATLQVVDRDVLNAFAARLRENPENSMPPTWTSNRMRNVIGNLLMQQREDAADAVDAFFKRSALDRIYSRNIRGAIGSIGGDAEAEANALLKAAGETALGAEKVLTVEQQKVVDFALKGYNIYLGGDAGTGKTVTITQMVESLRRQKLTVAVTASTGLAACHLGGTTFHSFAGIGRAHDFLQASKKMPIVDCIVIDEVSMLSGGLLHRFDQFLRAERCNDEPFGGTQIIICGDFLQLSFIVDSRRERVDALDRKSVFEIDVFRESFLCLKLVQQVRQAEHQRFAEQLRELRVGKVPHDLFETGIVNLDAAPGGPDAVPMAEGTIRLLPTNKQATEANTKKLAELPGDPVTFVPCATPPTLAGNWTTTAVLEVPPDGRFEIERFRSALHYHLRQTILDDAVSGMSRQGVLDGSGGAAYQDQSINNQTLCYLPESSVIAYQTHPDGCVARLMLPANKPEVAERLINVWNRSLGSISALAQQSCSNITTMNGAGTSAPPATPAAVAAASASTAAPAAAPSASAIAGKCTLIDVLPNGDALHTHQVEEQLSKDMQAHPVAQPLPLKIGAQVLLRVNISNQLVNGAVGTVVNFIPAKLDALPSYIRSNKKMAAALDAYVEHTRSSLGATEEAEPVIPVVRFRGIAQDVPIPPWPFCVGGDVSTHFYAMDVVALPLTLAYAFTAHKVQGLTLLSDVRIELEKMWDCEHIIYVAMSRVKSPTQLSIRGFRDELVLTSKAAVAFDRSVEAVSAVVDPAEDAAAAAEDEGAEGKSKASNVSLAPMPSATSCGFYRALWIRLREGHFNAFNAVLRGRGASATGPMLAGQQSATRHYRAMRKTLATVAAGNLEAAKRIGATFRPKMSDVARGTQPKWLRERLAAAAATTTAPPATPVVAPTAAEAEKDVPEPKVAEKQAPAVADAVPAPTGTIPRKAVAATKTQKGSLLADAASLTRNRRAAAAAAAAEDDVRPPLLMTKQTKGVAAAPVKLTGSAKARDEADNKAKQKVKGKR